VTHPRRLPTLVDLPTLTDEQRQALRILADCFADDGIVDDARNIRDALACLESNERHRSEIEAEAAALRVRLDETERRLRAADTAAQKDGWKGRAETAESKIDRLVQERNEARAAAQAILGSLKSQGLAVDAAETTAATLRQRVEALEDALRQALAAMDECTRLIARKEADVPGAGHAGFADVFGEDAAMPYVAKPDSLHALPTGAEGDAEPENVPDPIT
jgi:chromosome segregation ATPase